MKKLIGCMILGVAILTANMGLVGCGGTTTKDTVKDTVKEKTTEKVSEKVTPKEKETPK